jgi:predicted metalloprotease with PDZ domain
MNLIQDLSAKYGKQRGFKDSELFDEIGKITYPEIEQFLQTYVAGNQPLPLAQVFTSVGVEYLPEVETKDSSFTMGSIGLNFDNETKRLVISDVSNMNAFGKAMGYHVNDEIISINGLEMNRTNAPKFFRNFQTTSKAGENLVVLVARKDENGVEKTVELKGIMSKIPIVKYNVLRFSQTATEEQIKLRNEWLKPNGIQVL